MTLPLVFVRNFAKREGRSMRAILKLADTLGIEVSKVEGGSKRVLCISPRDAELLHLRIEEIRKKDLDTTRVRLKRIA